MPICQWHPELLPEQAANSLDNTTVNTEETRFRYNLAEWLSLEAIRMGYRCAGLSHDMDTMVA
eukprot:6214362-Pleurochrysis_carterae.AAC.2